MEDEYEDDDFNIYFDKASLLAHINFLEDDNLFKINLLQQDEANLDKILKKKAKSLAEKENDIRDVNANIEGFKQTKE